MKGLSPFIATILLIAFTVAVGGILSVWFSTITTSQTQTVQSGNDALSKCAGTTLTISQVRFNQTAGAVKLVNVTVTSSGTQTIKNITISVTGGGATANSIKFYNLTGDDFLPGATFATSINTTNITIPPELTSVSGICSGVYALTNQCKSGDSCNIASN